MEKENEHEHIIDRLRRGEKIKCKVCKNGIYKTSANDISIAHEFNCDKCGSVIRVTPNVIVK